LRDEAPQRRPAFALRFDAVLLRDRCAADLSDYVHWLTVETEWQRWDAPWEKREALDLARYEQRFMGALKSPRPDVRRLLEVDALPEGRHIGWVSRYQIEGDADRTAIGIDLPEQGYRGRGLGGHAFRLWMSYLTVALDLSDVYCQTWSGNRRMINLAGRCGFVETSRFAGIRQVRGAAYDALTFRVPRATVMDLHAPYVAAVRRCLAGSGEDASAGR